MADLEQAKDLAWLVKDNLRTKHLVLSVEEALVEFLKCEQAVLKLEPMGSYQRMLLHRLADNFGLKHESSGEGENRHLVIEKCQGSYIPSVLVSEVLADVPVEPLRSELHVLRRSSMQDDSCAAESSSKQPSTTVRLEEREAAYISARRRIFSSGNDSSAAATAEVAAPRQRAAVSVAARRMINHALGNGKAEERNKSKNPSQEGAQRLFAHALGFSRVNQ